MNKNSLRSIGIMGALASLAGIGRFNRSLNPLDELTRLLGRAKRWRSAISARRGKGRQHPGTYRGCKRDKFASMTRQRIRHIAKQAITEEVRAKFRLPRRILRAIVRTRGNYEWRNFGTVQPIIRAKAAIA